MQEIITLIICLIALLYIIIKVRKGIVSRQCGSCSDCPVKDCSKRV